jgi:hypothetical protein
LNEKIKPGKSVYQIEIENKEKSEHQSFFERKRLKKLKEKEEKRKKMEPLLKKLLELPQEESLRLSKIFY